MDIDITFIIQLSIFVGLIGILNPLVFQPFIKVFELRDEKITGRAKEAARLEGLAIQDQQAYEARLEEASGAASREREQLLAHGRQEERRLVTEARNDSAVKLGVARDRIRGEVEDARKQLDNGIEPIAQAIVEKLLGRRLS
ncbi:MAG: ATP synthase F0 subunit B [Myxococcota bacterium]|nr:ATP synthase F0 subunit B [Myxococcota bacterium]